jgi:kinesin family protein 3/17
MVANLGPADYSFDETLSTLRYANRAKNIKNKPRINEDPKDAMLREFQEEIARLRAALDGKGGPRKAREKVVEKVVEKEADASKIAQIKEQMKKELEANMRKSMTEEAREKALKEAQAKAAAQLKAVAAETGSTDKERKQAEKALAAQAAEIERLSLEMNEEMREQQELEQKIRAMESKVLHGGENLFEKHEQLEAEAKEAEERLAAQKLEEEEAKHGKQVNKKLADRYSILIPGACDAVRTPSPPPASLPTPLHVWIFSPSLPLQVAIAWSSCVRFICESMCV